LARRIRQHLTYANVLSSLALFLVLSGGTAVALTGSNTVFSDDIVNEEVKPVDLAKLSFIPIQPNPVTRNDDRSRPPGPGTSFLLPVGYRPAAIREFAVPYGQFMNAAVADAMRG
jgi:hypothetical protein